MNKVGRIITACVFGLCLVLVYCIFKNILEWNANLITLLTTSVMFLVFSFILEPFFSRPIEIAASSISILVLLLPQFKQLKQFSTNFPNWILTIYIFICALALLLAISSQFLLTNKRPEEASRNKISNNIRKNLEIFVPSKNLYFILGIILLLLYWYDQKAFFAVMLVYYIVAYFIDLKKNEIQKIFNRIFERKTNDTVEYIGQIIGQNSNGVFKACVINKGIELFDEVIYKSKFETSESFGLVIDKQYLNDQQRFDILKLKNVIEPHGLKDSEIRKTKARDDKIVGVVFDNTDINKLLFKYIPKEKIETGDVLYITIDDKKVLYQVTNGVVDSEKLNKLDIHGFVLGEAVQVGVWNKKKNIFEKHLWCPVYNSPVFKFERDLAAEETEKYTIGSVPNTNYRIEFDFEDGIRHHLAILGVTGCGKSVLTREIIREIIDRKEKVIAIDFTGEYLNKMQDLDTWVLFSKEAIRKNINKNISDYIKEMAEFRNNRNYNVIDRCLREIEAAIKNEYQRFIQDRKSMFAILEYPDMSNNLESSSFLKWYFKHTFDAIRESESKENICIVLEEAHTVVPEWRNSGGEDNKETQNMINTICQIALQGRKYNVGFIVIAQRTANVSKTVLTQCNSVIAFQQFDNTSKGFLVDYLSPEMVKALPNLKFRQCIVSGKAFKSTTPVIIEVPEIADETNEDDFLK